MITNTQVIDQIRYLESLEETFKELSGYIQWNLIKMPQEILREGIPLGFPEDIAENYITRFYPHNVAEAEEVTLFIDRLLMDYLERVKSDLEKARDR